MCERIICDSQTNTIKYDFPIQSFAKGSWDTFPFGDPSSHGCVLKETHVPLPSPLPQGNVGLVDADHDQREDKRKAAQKYRRHESAFVALRICTHTHNNALGGGVQHCFSWGSPRAHSFAKSGYEY